MASASAPASRSITPSTPLATKRSICSAVSAPAPAPAPSHRGKPMRVIEVEDGARRSFPDEPFSIRHRLVGEPLLTLDALAKLAGRLDRDRVEFNSGKLKPDQRPEDVPTVDLAPAEVVRQIETANAWLVLKNVETIPEYHALIKSALDDAAQALGKGDTAHAGMRDFQGFIFVASANAVTPFHLDYEQNFFVHLEGDKTMHIFDNRDRSLVS